MMKVYTILDSRDNHPLYVCSSKKLAQKIQSKLQILCYLEELPFLQDNDQKLELAILDES